MPEPTVLARYGLPLVFVNVLLVGLLLYGYVAFVWRRRRRSSTAFPRHDRPSGGDRLEAAQPGSYGQALRSPSIEETDAAERPRLLEPAPRTP